MGKELIKVKNLSKIFYTGGSELKALDNVSFSVNDNDFVAIIGKSGSGKSTLLHQLGLLDFPTSGAIHIDNIDVLKLSERERTTFRLKKLGYVFQDYALMPTLTALDNVMLPLLMSGYGNGKAKEIAINALEKVGLKERPNNLPSQLSGGEQQRVSIARAIANNPEILFADEPTANLDSETSKLILDLLIDLNKKGQTIIMVTHETDYMETSKKVIKLIDGKIV